MTKGEWAAWVQAIGSIAAILVGFASIPFDHYWHRRRRATALATMLQLLLGETLFFLRYVGDDEHKTFWLDFVRKEGGALTRLREVTTSVDVSEVNHPGLLIRYAGVLMALDNAIARTQGIPDALPTRDYLIVDLESLRDAVKEALDEVHGAFPGISERKIDPLRRHPETAA